MMALLPRWLLAAALAITTFAVAGTLERARAQGTGGYDGYEDYDQRQDRAPSRDRAPYRDQGQNYGQDRYRDQGRDQERYPDQGYGSNDDRAADDSYRDDAPYDDTPYDAAADDEDEYEDGREVPDVSYFYDELEPHGRWVHHREYGQVWLPYETGPGWRPYTRGHWVNTEEHGWYWASDEPFGWATYHYGRWFLDEDRGWVWVPGTRWGPAWVAWRSSDEYVGWAPLPPDAYWEPRRGLHYSTTIYEEPRYQVYWSFVQPAYISHPRIYERCEPWERTHTIIYRTRPQTNYVLVNRRIVNRGVSVTSIERVTHTRIVTRRITVSNEYGRRGADRSDGEVIRTYRPKLTRYNAVRGRKAGRPAVVIRDVDRRVVRHNRAQPRAAHPVAAAPRASGLGNTPAARAMLGPYRATPSGPPKRVTLPPGQYTRIKPGMSAYERAQVRAQQDRAVRARAAQQANARKAAAKGKAASSSSGSGYGNVPR